MSNDSAISLSLTAPITAAAQRAAADEHRTVASLIERLLTDHLRAKGYLRDRHSDEGLRPDQLTSENDE